MTPQWALWILGFAAFVFLALGIDLFKKSPYHSIWMFVITAVFALFVTMSIYRNDNIQKEEEAKKPKYSGYLTPGNAPTPPLPHEPSPSIPKDFKYLFIGGNVLVTKFEENFVLLYDSGKSNKVAPLKNILQLKINKDEMKIDADIVDSKNNNMCRIIDNEVKIMQENTFNPKLLDGHSLIVRDWSGEEVLNISYLNPSAIKISGRFYVEESVKPIIINDGGIFLPGGGKIHGQIIETMGFLIVTPKNFALGIGPGRLY